MTDRLPKRRADLLLVERGMFDSRARARAAIIAGGVTADGRRVAKPSETLAPDAEIVAAAEHPYVSRAALKLIAGLDAFALDPRGLTCLDLGASTGGFSQVLLARGAAGVHAVDVGHGQLHGSLASDPRVLVHEGLNARDLGATHLSGTRIEAVVADLSFISLKLALPPALSLAAPGAWGLFLVKPQFEVGRAHVGKGGIVREEGLAEQAACGIADWLGAQPGWRVLGLVPSPILGGDGNAEFLLAAARA